MHRIICLFSALLCAALPVFAQNTTTTPALAADFPKFVDTGDAKADNARYDAAKKAWIEANPKAYARLVGSEAEAVTMPAEQEKTNPTIPPAPESSAANSPAPTSTEIVRPLPDHYPRIVATGNIAADEAAHIKAKNEWIKRYPAEYEAMGGKIDIIAIEQPIANQDNNDNNRTTTQAPIDITACGDCLLAQNIYIGSPNEIENREQIQKMRDEITNSQFWLDPQNAILYVQSDANSLIRVYKYRIDKGQMTWLNCEECNDMPPGKLIEQPNNTMLTLYEHHNDDIYINIIFKK